MSNENSRDIYNNGHCRVEIKLFPDENQENLCKRDQWGFPQWERPFAKIVVHAKDTATCRTRCVFAGDEQTTKKVGHLWWRRSIVVKKTTQEERLESVIIEAIKFADRHFERFTTMVAAGDEAIHNTQHLVNAIKDVNELVRNPEE